MKTRKKIYKIVSNKYVKLFVDVAMFSVAIYFVIKKITGFSATGWLVNNVFKQGLVDFLAVVALIALVIAALLKFAAFIFECFPPLVHNFSEHKSISVGLAVMNQELKSHLNKLREAGMAGISDLKEQQSFARNQASIVDVLGEHIKKSIKNVELEDRDLFISLYGFDMDDFSLNYLTHFVLYRDLVNSERIDLNDNTYCDYECVKLVKSTNKTKFVLNGKVDYAAAESRRHKTVKHYLGYKLFLGDVVYGVLNVEFHNKTVFPDEDEMDAFIEEHIVPFKLLLEYQFLKRDFLHSFDGLRS